MADHIWITGQKTQENSSTSTGVIYTGFGQGSHGREKTHKLSSGELFRDTKLTYL